MNLETLHIAALRIHADKHHVKNMCVVCYDGFRDNEGLIDKTSDLSRRYGLRDSRHAKIYGFRVIYRAGEAA